MEQSKRRTIKLNSLNFSNLSFILEFLLFGENTFASKLTGSETAITTNYGTLKISADNLDVALTNAVDATLNLGSGKLTKAILGEGTTQIGDGTNDVEVTLGEGATMEGNVAIKAKGKFTVDDSSTIAGNIHVEQDGMLAIDYFDVVYGTVTNDGGITYNGTKIAKVIDSSSTDKKGILNLQKATEIAEQINNQSIVLNEGYSTATQASYISQSNPINDLFFYGGGFDFTNNGKATTVSDYKFNEILIATNGNLKLNVDLAAGKTDTLNATNVSGSGTLHIKALNLLSDATQDTTTIKFTDTLGGYIVNDVVHVTSATSKIKYGVEYSETSYKQDGAQNWWEVSLGGGWNLTDTSYFYAELTKHFKDVSNSLNFNLGFRFTL